MINKHDQFMCHRFYRNALTREISQCFWDVLPHKLTLDPNYVFPTFDPDTWKTLFQEVDVVKPMDALTEAEKAILDNDRCQGWKGGNDAMLSAMEKCLIDFITLNWRNDEFHLLFHSSGYDSRIVSGTLAKLRDTVGNWRLGDLLFVCVGPESDEFGRIMEYEGWRDDQYIALPDLAPAYEYIVDFDNAWKWVNGPYNYGYNLNYAVVDRLQHMGLVPEDDSDVQIWTGRNDIAYEIWEGVDWSLKQDYIHNYSAVTSVVQYKAGDLVLPMMGYELMKILSASELRVGWAALRPDLMHHIDPGLSKFERKSIKFPPLSGDQFERMCNAYDRSWYGKNVCLEVEPIGETTAYDEWWSRWTCAVVVEHLLEKGYDISIS